MLGGEIPDDGVGFAEHRAVIDHRGNEADRVQLEKGWVASRLIAASPVLALVLILWNRLPLTVWYIGVALGAAIFVWSSYMGAFHAGVEWGFWAGPSACTGTGTGSAGLDFNQLQTGNIDRVVPCDQVQFRFLGISLAGYNALISLAIVAMLISAMIFQLRRKSA